LLFRLDVVPIELPPLYTRKNDIPLLAKAFLEDAKSRIPTSPVKTMHREVLTRFANYRWPGNVRELKHVVERLVLLGTSAEVTENDLPPSMLEAESATPSFAGNVMPIRRMQALYAQWALEQYGGLKKKTAEALGVDIKTLSKYLTNADVDAKDAKDDDDAKDE
jgi:two-component system response regulator HydG